MDNMLILVRNAFKSLLTILKGLSNNIKFWFYPKGNVRSLWFLTPTSFMFLVNVTSSEASSLITWSKIKGPIIIFLPSFIFFHSTDTAYHYFIYLYFISNCLMSNFPTFPLEFKLYISKNLVFVFLLLLLFTVVFPEPTVVPGK